MNSFNPWLGNNIVGKIKVKEVPSCVRYKREFLLTINNKLYRIFAKDATLKDVSASSVISEYRKALLERLEGGIE